MTEKIDCTIIGAGIVGLAVARALALDGREVIVLENQDAIGTVISSRNSEVLHAGIYYPEGSLKGKFCVEGREMIYAYCAERGIGARRCGKLVVATDDSQIPALEDLWAGAKANGVDDIEWLDADQAISLEPALHCVAALLSPSTGILDSHAFMLSLQGEAEDRGAMIAFNSPVVGGRATDQGIALEVGGAEPMGLICANLINCAGLGAQDIALSIEGMADEKVPPLYYAKGSYFFLSGRAPFSRLIYPLPTTASLGMHYTLDMGGQGRFGPDVEWVDEIDYTVDPRRAAGFYQSIRRYWPEIEDGSLRPGYSGIRPKLQAPGEPVRDFVIQGPEIH
ncbi:MAG: NAD(P)/FAD-dependent oxidoreductase, partial [Rhodospirillales bacterium]